MVLDLPQLTKARPASYNRHGGTAVSPQRRGFHFD
jgi:hypothetical protein